jgi:hypothetical protein
MASPSIIPYTQMAGDQTVTVPNGIYSAGNVNTAHAATAGVNKGWLVLKAASQGGVTVDQTPPASGLSGTLPDSAAQNGRMRFEANASRILFVGFKFTNGLMDLITKNSTNNIGFWYCTFEFTPARWISYSPAGNPVGYYPAPRTIGNFWITDGWFAGCTFLETGTALACGETTRLTVQGCDFQGPFHDGGYGDIVHPNCFSSYLGNRDIKILDTTLRGRCNFADNNGTSSTNGAPCTGIEIKRVINIHSVTPHQFIANKPAAPRGVSGVMENCYMWNPSNASQRSRVDIVSNVQDGVPPYNQTPTRVNVVDTNNVNYQTAFPGYPGSMGVTEYMAVWRAANPYASYATYFGWATPAPSAPGTPTGLIADALTYASGQVSWTEGTGTIVTTEIGYGPDGTFTSTAAVPQGTLTVTLNGLVASTTYSVRVRHTNETGNSSYTATVTFTTPAQPVPGPGNATPTIVGFGAKGTTSGTTLTLATLADVQEDDLLLAFITGQSATAFPLTLPSGWATVDADQTPNAAFGGSLSYKVAVSADVGLQSYIFSHAAATSTSSFGRILILRGADTASPIDVSDVDPFTGAVTSHVAPAITTTVDHTRYLVFVGSDNGAAPVTYTTPAGLTELWDLSVTGGPFCGNAAFHVAGGLAGLKSTFTATASEAQEGVAWAVAVAPVAQWSLPALNPRIELAEFSGDGRNVGAIVTLT